MKLDALLSLAIGLIAGFTAMSTLAAGPVCQIVIGSCHRPPLSAPESTGIIDGIVVEAFRRIGLKACIEPLPCERSLMNADGGQIDGDILRIPAVIGARYPNLVGVPETLYSMSMTGFTKSKELAPKNLSDLTPLRVGFILGWKVLEDGVKATDTLRVRGPEELFPLLKDGKADVVIYDRLTGLHIVKELGLDGIRVLDPPFVTTHQAMVLNRRHEHLAGPLADAIRAIKADGSYGEAFRRAGYAPPPVK
jgi:polar amino acid transport system substrate-binding protein